MLTIAGELLGCFIVSFLFTAILFLEHESIVPIRTGWLGWLANLPRPVAVWLRGSILLFLILLGGDLVAWLGPYATNLFGVLMRVMGLKLLQLATGLLVIVIGILAYWFKKENQVAYGVVEVMVAGSAGVVAAKQIAPGASIPPIVAALVAAVYVVSRGIGNFDEGRTKRKATDIATSQTTI
jgi:hypothetical protein